MFPARWVLRGRWGLLREAMAPAVRSVQSLTLGELLFGE